MSTFHWEHSKYNPWTPERVGIFSYHSWLFSHFVVSLDHKTYKHATWKIDYQAFLCIFHHENIFARGVFANANYLTWLSPAVEHFFFLLFCRGFNLIFSWSREMAIGLNCVCYWVNLSNGLRLSHEKDIDSIWFGDFSCFWSDLINKLVSVL